MQAIYQNMVLDAVGAFTPATKIVHVDTLEEVPLFFTQPRTLTPQRFVRQDGLQWPILTITKVRYLTPGTDNTWQDQEPQNVRLDQRVGIKFFLKSNYHETFRIGWIGFFFNLDGDTFRRRPPGDFIEVKPRQTITIDWTALPSKRAHKVYPRRVVIFFANYARTADWIFETCMSDLFAWVQMSKPPTLLEIPEVKFWDPNSNNWEDKFPLVEAGEKIGIRLLLRNLSNEQLNGLVLTSGLPNAGLPIPGPPIDIPARGTAYWEITGNAHERSVPHFVQINPALPGFTPGKCPIEPFWYGAYATTIKLDRVPETPPTGMLHRATVINDETNERWELDEFPVRLPIGAPVRVIARGVNTSGRTLDLRITVELIDPNDNVRARRVRVNTVQHEEEISSRTTVPPIQLDLDGVWKIRAKLEVNPIPGQAQADDELPIEETWEAIIVGEQPVRWLLPAAIGTIVLIGGIAVVSYKRRNIKKY